MLGFDLMTSKVDVANRVAAFESMPQCETSSARAPAYKNARARPDRASAPGFAPAAVLQADSTTQSALSLSCATSLAVNSPSSSSLDSLGNVNASDGSPSPSMSPATKPCVAK